ncbi:P-loop containing nucleoside triphosphate hydrolase protein [Dunaliella salina]|uniref:DNA 3'-5' helicase n=1 Tax=Dunaliella salina TaxID=3046 RepID=A0ABQ7GV91_DUNSA|nr:P-loop containing nucleoside triphosphate hydrolase protein [Dunaliella salina]|eukprot:KAF5838538.1 P-loop containing nucleoside triphosphate hydrolase protein [Dunaliella salina]
MIFSQLRQTSRCLIKSVKTPQGRSFRASFAYRDRRIGRYAVPALKRSITQMFVSRPAVHPWVGVPLASRPFLLPLSAGPGIRSRFSLKTSAREGPEDEKPRKGRKAGNPKGPAKGNSSLSALNDEQQAAASDPCHAIYVKAGPGTGKTQMLAARVQYLLEKKRSVLVFTFTKRAALEIKERINSKSVVAATFHSICLGILTSKDYNIEDLGTGHSKNFKLFDEDDAKDALKMALWSRLQGQASLETINKLTDTLMEAFKVVKNLRPTTYKIDMAQVFQEALDGNKISLNTISDKHVPLLDAAFLAELFGLYQRELLLNNALDLADLLGLTVALLQEVPYVRRFYNNKYSDILVDEFQDTNPPQFALASLLKGDAGNIFVVGDADQMIYSWRGTDSTVMGQNFQSRWPDCSIRTLSENYRSPQVTLDASRAVLYHERAVPPDYQPLRASAHKPGGVFYVAIKTPKEEAHTTVSIIQKTLSAGMCFSDVAVLYRTKRQASRDLQECLKDAGIPFIILGSDSLWENKEVRLHL